jgi:hypothetical protein
LEKHLNILVLCRNQQLLDTLVRVIRDKSPWHPVVGDFDRANFSFLNTTEFDILLVGSGFSEEEECALASHLHQFFPEKHLVYHYGGGSGLLFSEIHHKLDESIPKQVGL